MEKEIKKVSVCHVSSVHPRTDSRIFWKQCVSLVRNGFEVNFVVADGLGDSKIMGVSIWDVGKESNRLNRVIKSTEKVYNKATELNADIYHAHDPELLLVCLRLKRRGKYVIYDAHEDLPVQIKHKAYLNPLLRRMVSGSVKIVQNWMLSKISGVITATKYITDKLSEANKNCVTIHNYPILKEFRPSNKRLQHLNEIVYVGGISKDRGIIELVKALDYVGDVKLNLVGAFSSQVLEGEVKQLNGWSKVKAWGYCSREKVGEILAQSSLGLVTLRPIENYKVSLPIKMFEYMGAGLPVICSNFPLWEQIIEKNNCGICVDPENPVHIAKAINLLLNDEEKMRQMSENGLREAKAKYNWRQEEKSLLAFYGKVLATGVQ